MACSKGLYFVAEFHKKWVYNLHNFSFEGLDDLVVILFVNGLIIMAMARIMSMTIMAMMIAITGSR